MAPAVITASSASLLLFRPPSSHHRPSSSAVFRCPPSSLSFRSKDLILERCTTTYWLKKKGVDFACKSQGKSCLQTTIDRFLLFHEHQAGPSLTTPTVSGRSQSMIRRQAYKYNSFGFRVPSNAEKPEWWWRTLSCVPYLVALWVSNTGFFLSPLLENFKYFEDVVFYIPGAVTPLPAWFHMVYYYLALGLVVKNKEWPLLFRFNVMMGLLLETALQVVWYSANFFPIIHYNGTLGMYFWAGLTLAYILLMLKCIRCALLGTFVKIPLMSESAFIHSLFHIGGFQRPF
ncbi:hypothetical protein L6164_018759 [Bauhinia variegata]|uniref:Uncharacterized protein n=1 Tax=Bauhinia variegata TaxID=167791 RepID=A0ACB9NC13_BAUVA|nr:hypothetical protein L6164_018759 [Bauhinia variegata]